MWNKLSLRVKITVLTVLTLTALCAGLTTAAILNTSVFYDPIAYAIDKKPLEEGSIKGEHHIQNTETATIIDEIYLGSRNQFKIISILTAVCVILIGSFFAWLLTGKTLKPLHTFAEQIEDINENNLSGQITLSQSSREVSSLTSSFNNMLETLDRAFNNKKLFASNAAHELKTPLTNILTNIEVMQMDDNPSIDDYKEVIGITKENMERLKVLIQDLLHFNTQTNEEDFTDIRADELFKKVLEDLTLDIREKNIKTSIKGQTVLYGDKNLLERAFYNLIQNAVNYNRENGEINIVIHNNTITIADTGIGIPEESLSQIFDPFYCADKSRSRGLGGSGLGLSIVKQIFDKHEIKTVVSSELDKGTKILMELPQP